MLQRFRSLNFYWLTGLGLLVWLLAFDANDLITQGRMQWKLQQLKQDSVFYFNQIEEVKRERREVMGTPKLVEKFAREKYLMKKPGEEIFVIVDENNEPLEK
ncbi:MAG: septum formation initiator family protein [Sphingobacteriaceae bacterium]|nr:septum formation initiator family protein [Cytophagaceae bacterium]